MGSCKLSTDSVGKLQRCNHRHNKQQQQQCYKTVQAELSLKKKDVTITQTDGNVHNKFVTLKNVKGSSSSE
jgi:hypothetical protein